jgi:hypothetical protein
MTEGGLPNNLVRQIERGYAPSLTDVLRILKSATIREELGRGEAIDLTPSNLAGRG